MCAYDDPAPNRDPEVVVVVVVVVVVARRSIVLTKVAGEPLARQGALQILCARLRRQGTRFVKNRD